MKLKQYSFIIGVSSFMIFTTVAYQNCSQKSFDANQLVQDNNSNDLNSTSDDLSLSSEGRGKSLSRSIEKLDYSAEWNQSFANEVSLSQINQINNSKSKMIKSFPSSEVIIRIIGDQRVEITRILDCGTKKVSGELKQLNANTDERYTIEKSGEDSHAPRSCELDSLYSDPNKNISISLIDLLMSTKALFQNIENNKSMVSRKKLNIGKYNNFEFVFTDDKPADFEVKLADATKTFFKNKFFTSTKNEKTFFIGKTKLNFNGKFYDFSKKVTINNDGNKFTVEYPQDIVEIIKSEIRSKNSNSDTDIQDTALKRIDEIYGNKYVPELVRGINKVKLQFVDAINNNNYKCFAYVRFYNEDQSNANQEGRFQSFYAEHPKYTGPFYEGNTPYYKVLSRKSMNNLQTYLDKFFKSDSEGQFYSLDDKYVIECEEAYKNIESSTSDERLKILNDVYNHNLTPEEALLKLF